MKILGIDTSKWNGAMDWRLAIANGAKFAYIKASQWGPDERFTESWKNSKGLLPRGAYHFLDWGWSEVDQAKLFVKTMGNDLGELPPCLDLEQQPSSYGLDPALVSRKAWRFLTTVESLTGRTPTIYTGYYFWNYWGSRDEMWTRFHFWLPWYASELYIKLASGGTGAPKPWKDWTFWQYSSKANGLAYGCQSLRVDINQFNGTEEDLSKFAGGASIPTSVPPIENLYVANCNPRVRSSPDSSSDANVIGMLVMGTRVIVDEVQGNWAHFSPQTNFPAGGWAWKDYLTKI